MKLLLQTLFFFLLAAQICFGQWVQVGLNDEVIKDIAVRDATIFAVTSDSGKVFRSIDNGVNWTMIVDSCAIDVDISSTGKIFMTQDSILHQPFERKTSLLSSLDNGENWMVVNIIEQIKDSLQYPWDHKPLNITVNPAGVIFCYVPEHRHAGSKDCFAKSTDDGVSWTGYGASIRGGRAFDFRNQFWITIGFVRSSGGGTGSWIYLSSDYGNNWAYLGWPPLAYDFFTLALFSNDNIIIGGNFDEEGRAILLSTDMCSTWTQISSLNIQVGISYLHNSLEGMLIGTEDLGVFLFSDEGDSLGSRNEGLTNLNIQSLTLDNNGYLYAGTENGVWRRPLTDIVTSVKNDPTQPTDFLLSQNFPNPFNPSTKISWQSPVGSHQTIKVFDVLGNEIATLVDEYKPAGSYEVEFNAERLASGIYFYQLRAGDYVNTKKMILIK